MATKEWHLLISGPSSTWAKLYDRHFGIKLKKHREQRLYRNLKFEFDPVVEVEAEVYDKIKNDAAFIETTFRALKPLIAKMLRDVEEAIGDAAHQHKVEGTEARKQARKRINSRVKAPSGRLRPKSSWNERLASAQKDIYGELVLHEEGLQAEAKRQLDAWTGLPKDVKRYSKQKRISKIKVTASIGVAVVGAGVGTMSVILSPGIGLVGAIGAWYGLARTIAGGVQEWRLLNKDLNPLLESIRKDIEGFSKQTNHKTRAVGAGIARGATGRNCMNQVGRFEPKVTQLKTKLPKLKLNESGFGKLINESLDATEKLLPALKAAENHPRRHFISEMEVLKINDLRRSVEKHKTCFNKLLDGQIRSYELEQWIKFVGLELKKIRASRGKTAAILEESVSAIVSLSLNWVPAGIGVSGGIDLKSLCAVTKAAGALDTAGLALGGLADLEGLVGDVEGAFEEYEAVVAAKRS